MTVKFLTLIDPKTMPPMREWWGDRTEYETRYIRKRVKDEAVGRDQAAASIRALIQKEKTNGEV